MKKLIITGNLGKDPEQRIDPSGNPFVTFSVAVSVGNKQNSKADWVDVSCNGRLAEMVCNYLKKGMKVIVSGFPTVNAYINRENVAVAVLRMYADGVEFLSPRVDSEQNLVGEMHQINGDAYQLAPVNPS